ncbi:AAA family ATPase [Candidatus Thiosymbion oneisti]|uniref:AAA family ATPase n=1 Tax=Candidatus Thiosymbion oneisti TaxID=589554 RepID=UPI000AC8CD26|nr:AAA family ATPase [Candidatus Thiosymbion oneisti]
MIPHHAQRLIEDALARQAAVAVIGPRQVGKTTLALEIAQSRPAIYLDLEAMAGREKLSDPVLFLDQQVDKLVVLDEIHRMPALFEALRGIIDAGRRSGRRTGRFLILGIETRDELFGHPVVGASWEAKRAHQSIAVGHGAIEATDSIAGSAARRCPTYPTRFRPSRSPKQCCPALFWCCPRGRRVALRRGRRRAPPNVFSRG